MAAFATTNDVALRLRRSLTADEEIHVDELLEDATDLIRAATGQMLYPSTSSTVTLHGCHRRLLQLPQVPVTAVTSVTVDAGVFVSGVHFTWSTQGVLRRISGTWPDNVVVVYTHGYAAVPDDLARFTARLALNEFGGGGSGAIRSESVGSYSVTYRDDPTKLLDEYPMLLSAYMPDRLP